MGTQVRSRLGPRVWVYPEREWRQIGEERWVAKWWALKPGHSADPEGYRDLLDDYEEHAAAHPSRAKALQAARLILNTGRASFGSVEVVRQTVDWYVEEDRMGEWSDADDSEEVR